MCAVPPTLPSDREGIGAYPAAGPYYVAEHVPGVRVEIRRNPFYRGGVRTTSTASPPTCARARSTTSSTASSAALPTGDGCCPRCFSNRAGDSPRDTASTGGVSSSARHDDVRVRLQHDEAALPRQPEAPTGRQLRDRPSGHPSCRRRRAPEPADGPVHPARDAGLLGRPDLPARSTRPRPSARARAGQHARRRGRPLHRRLASTARRGAGGQARPREDRPGRPDPRRSAARRTSDGLAPVATTTSAFGPGCPTTTTRFAVLNVNFDGRFIGDSNWARLDSPGVNRRSERRRIAHGSRATSRLRCARCAARPRRLRRWSRSRS